MASKLWDHNNPMFMYGNEAKLDDLLSRAFDTVVTGYETSQTNGYSLEATIKSLFSIADISSLGFDVSGGFSYERAKTEISAITFDKKLSMLTAYCEKNEEFPYINAYEGTVLVRNCEKGVPEWKPKVIEDGDKKSCVGQVLSIFTAEQLTGTNMQKSLHEQLFEDQQKLYSSPKLLFKDVHSVSQRLVDDCMENRNNLWLFKSVEESKVQVELPMILSNIRPVSQMAMLTFMTFKEYKIEATGLLYWEGDKILCDPIAWRLFR